MEGTRNEKSFHRKVRRKKRGLGGWRVIGELPNWERQWVFKRGEDNSHDNRKRDIRILPAFVMHLILKGTVFVILNEMLVLGDLGFVEEFVVKAQHFLVLLEHWKS